MTFLKGFTSELRAFPSSHPGAFSDVAIQHNTKLALFKDNLICQELDGVPRERIEERE